MREIASTLSSKGQITIPAEVRKFLGVEQGDKLSFVIEDEGVVRLVAPRYRSIKDLAGAAGSLKKPMSWEQMREIAREDHVKEIMKDE